MTLLVRKKNGALEDFDNSKLAKAAKSSFLNVGYSDDDAEAAGWRVASDVESQVRGRNEINREELHDLVQLSLMDINKHAAVAYIVYRNNQRNKHGQVDTLINALRSISKETSKENANIANSPPAKMLQIGEAANKHYVLNYILPKKLAKPHIDGDYHIHDLPWYTVTYNCIVYNVGKLLRDGFYMPNGFIRKPGSIVSAAALTAVTLQSVQNK